MGEVYKATDTRLDRVVAIKVLPSQVAGDPHFRARFEREARTLGSLHHAHICPIHDVGSADGVDYLVMEFLDGETLADRLRSGHLPLAAALTIAIEIADALDTAHRAGVVHRDLKPANIMLTKDGAKLLDFGIARVRSAVSTGLSMLPTAPPNLTIQGTVLGTYPYMAPEQVEGGEADARSDIFALGAVLFEMITGRGAFAGQTQASVMTAILRDTPPPLSSVIGAAGDFGPGRLHNLEDTVRRCLAKDANDRWQSARDLTLHLRWIAEDRAETLRSGPVTKTRQKAAYIAAWSIVGVALVVAALAAARSALRPSAPPAPVVRFSIDAPAGAFFAPTKSISAPHPVISPDGRQVAFLMQVGTEPVRIWVRALDSVDARPLRGTEGADFPFWSADNRFLGFFADGALKTIDAMGGSAAHRVCDAPAGEGGTWNGEGTIVFAPGPGGGLAQVSAAGGAATPVTTPSPSRGSAPHRWPSFLPDGRHFVFLEGDSIALASLASSDVRTLTQADSQAVYSGAGYLLFMRGTTLLAQAFDPQRGALAGEPHPVADGVSRALSNAAFSVSTTGVLVYRSGRLVSRQLTWFDRAGTPLGSVAGVHDFNGVHLSPDERKVAYHRHDGRPDGDVWLVDLDRGTSERFTHSAENNAPVWSPDGTRIAYSSNRDSGVNNLWVKASIGTEPEAPALTSSLDKSPRSWSSDGMLAFEAVGARGDIWILPLAAGGTPFPFLQTAFDERDPTFSPDGRWLAYRSDESGQNEVYVRPFPKGAGRWVVSTGGGTLPRWRGDGRELFYQVNQEIWTATIETTPSGVQVGVPHRLFDIGVGSSGWDVTRDGQRLLVGHGVEDRAAGTLSITVNWLEALRH